MCLGKVGPAEAAGLTKIRSEHKYLCRAGRSRHVLLPWRIVLVYCEIEFQNSKYIMYNDNSCFQYLIESNLKSRIFSFDSVCIYVFVLFSFIRLPFIQFPLYQSIQLENRMALHTTSALRLVALRESLFTLYLYSGLRLSVSGKVTSKNGNLRNLCYTKNICHVTLATIV